MGVERPSQDLWKSSGVSGDETALGDVHPESIGEEPTATPSSWRRVDGVEAMVRRAATIGFPRRRWRSAARARRLLRLENAVFYEFAHTCPWTGTSAGANMRVVARGRGAAARGSPSPGGRLVDTPGARYTARLREEEARVTGTGAGAGTPLQASPLFEAALRVVAALS